MRMVFIAALTVAGSASLSVDAGARIQEVPVALTIEQMDTITAGDAGVGAFANAFVFGTPGRASVGTDAFVSTNRINDIARGSARAFACCTPLTATIATVNVYGTGDNVFLNRVGSGNYFQTNTHAASSARETGSAIAFGGSRSERDATAGGFIGFALPLRP